MKVGNNYKQKSHFLCLGLLNIRGGSSVNIYIYIYIFGFVENRAGGWPSPAGLMVLVTSL